MKLKKITRNIKYFVPLIFKSSPVTIIMMVLGALTIAVRNISWVVIPKLILDELFYDETHNNLIFIISVFIAINLITSIFSNVINSVKNYNIRKVDFYIDKIFNEKVANVDYHNIEDPKFNDELSYARKCLSQYSGGIYSICYNIESIISSIISLIGVLGIVLTSGEILVIILMIISIILNGIIYSKFQKIDEDFNKEEVGYYRKQWYYNQSIFSFRTQKNIRLYDANELINEKSDKLNKHAFSVERKTAKKRTMVDSFESIVDYIITGLGMILLLAYSVYYKGITISVFTMLYSGVNSLTGSISSIIYSLRTYYQDCVYQEHFIDLMEKESIFKNGNEEISKIETIEFKNVSFKYPRTDVYVLKNLSFSINNKEKISLVGLNGSGKTTIIKLICRFYEVKEGEILVNGKNINCYKYDDYMKCLSVVFQDFKIISFNIKSNIAIVDDNKEKLDDVLKRSQVYDRVNELPDKEYTYINKWFNKKGVEFSGGEMQKFALARALYKEADLVVLDEPTSALDPVSEAEIYYHFNDVVGKKLTLFISHRLSSCIFSDKILVLDGNKIVESGNHKELISNKDGLYYKMFTAQAEYYKDN